MNREILFRGKRADNGEWIYGGIVHQTDYYGTKIDCYRIIDGTNADDYDIRYSRKVIPDSIGQYTGLQDRNGNKIFEGDVLIYIDPDEQEYDANERFVVRWDDETAGFLIEMFYRGESTCFDEIVRTQAECYEIVGNIFENVIWEEGTKSE